MLLGIEGPDAGESPELKLLGVRIGTHMSHAMGCTDNSASYGANTTCLTQSLVIHKRLPFFLVFLLFHFYFILLSNILNPEHSVTNKTKYSLHLALTIHLEALLCMFCLQMQVIHLLK